MDTKNTSTGYENKAILVSAFNIELIHDALALDGNGDPTEEDIRDAVAYAIQKVYRRRVEDAAIFA